MPFEFICPFCGVETWVDDHLRGQSGPCAGCGEVVTLPEAAEELEQPPGKPRRRVVLGGLGQGGWWKVGAAAVASVGLFLTLVSLVFWPHVTNVGNKVQRTECENRMKRIVGALVKYHAEHGAFPPSVVRDASGKPMHSWRVLLLPKLGGGNLLKGYDMSEPWDSSGNIALAARCPSVYQCPLDSDARLAGLTSYLLLVGPETVVDRAELTIWEELIDLAGNRVLLVEQSASDVVWSEPRDAEWRGSELSVGYDDSLIRSEHGAGGHVAMLSGDVAFLDQKTTPAELRRLFMGDGSTP